MIITADYKSIIFVKFPQFDVQIHRSQKEPQI
jgi:hypothetical protein